MGGAGVRVRHLEEESQVPVINLPLRHTLRGTRRQDAGQCIPHLSNWLLQDVTSRNSNMYVCVNGYVQTYVYSFSLKRLNHFWKEKREPDDTGWLQGEELEASVGRKVFSAHLFAL